MDTPIPKFGFAFSGTIVAMRQTRPGSGFEQKKINLDDAGPTFSTA